MQRTKKGQSRAWKILSVFKLNVSMGFMSTSSNPPKALFLCGEKLGNSSRKPAYLQQHLTTKHTRHVVNLPEFSRMKIAESRSRHTKK